MRSPARHVLAFALAVAVASAACRAGPRASAVKTPPVASDPAEEAEADDDDDDAGAEAPEEAEPSESVASGPCPPQMALVESDGRRFCVDKYEASLVEVTADGSEQPYAHYLPVDGHDVRAVSEPGVFPQGFISEVQARDACAASSKRLCTHEEWKLACAGPSKTTFPYGNARRPGTCHDTGKSAVIAVFGAKAVAASTPAAPAPTKDRAQGGKRAHVTKGRAAQSTRARPPAKPAKPSPAGKPSKRAPKKGAPPVSPHAATKRTGKKSTRPASVDPGVWAKLNDPALGQVEGALSKTGDHPECVNDYGVFDMVGNLHEWVATDPALAHGTFAGGYYLDTTINGDGCNYRTVAHAHDYHDYSTGFRCCAEAR
ncbi:MAG: hypothetical protein KF819_23425 [Labilithrix sp.]|nr:hypothetical protein [Labilithrix sp.]